MINMDHEFSNWALLPIDILDLILQKLFCVVDFVPFSVVSKQWYSAACQNKKKHLQVPMLLVPTEDGKCSVYSFAIYDFQLNIPFNKRLSGSSLGWVVIANKSPTMIEGISLTLLNPFSGKTICLPPVSSNYYYHYQGSYRDSGNNGDNAIISDFLGDDDSGDDDDHSEDLEEDGFGIGCCEYRITKVALSTDPHLCPDNFELLILFTDMGKLALYKSSEKSWFYLPDHPKLSVLEDVIFYKNKFYFVDRYMGLGRIDNVVDGGGVFSLNPKINVVLGHLFDKSDPIFQEMYRTYTVGTSSGDILFIQRFLTIVYLEQYCYYQLKTLDFMVYKLEFPRWVPIDSLGDDVLFLGDNQSMSVSALSFLSVKEIAYTSPTIVSILWKIILGKINLLKCLTTLASTAWLIED
ncbi:F-box protein [Quillaja saponaria]|uniref:F-box protein n=1 Tax=Quillaja saponaria TaxID=32244 RepID=A0AAD7LKD2_QUISA|nr:F-box protein [Quillaja saponaria]